MRICLIRRPPGRRSATSASASAPSPAAFEAFTNTTSPGCSSARSRASAASASATMVASDPHDPSMTAPWCMALIGLPVPTTMSRETSNRTASRPMRSCSDIASSPSSAISPSTAQLRAFRRTLARHPGQRLQAGAHRVRVGVVGVVDDGDAVGAGADLHPVPRRRARGGQRRGHLLAGRRRTPGPPRPRTARWTPDGRRAPPVRRRPARRPRAA